MDKKKTQKRASVKTKPIRIRKKLKIKGLKNAKRKIGKLIIDDNNLNANNTRKALNELQNIKNMFKKGKLTKNDFNSKSLKTTPKTPAIRKKSSASKKRNLSTVFNYAKNLPDVFNL